MADQVRQRDFDTYVARADEARRGADAATLANVRERCLRAEAAWLGLAGRIPRTEVMRTASPAQHQAPEGAVPT